MANTFRNILSTLNQARISARPEFKEKQDRYLRLLPQLVETGRIADQEQYDQYLANIEAGIFEIPGETRRGTGEYETIPAEPGTQGFRQESRYVPYMSEPQPIQGPVEGRPAYRPVQETVQTMKPFIGPLGPVGQRGRHTIQPEGTTPYYDIEGSSARYIPSQRHGVLSEERSPVRMEQYMVPAAQDLGYSQPEQMFRKETTSVPTMIGGREAYQVEKTEPIPLQQRYRDQELHPFRIIDPETGEVTTYDNIRTTAGSSVRMKPKKTAQRGAPMTPEQKVQMNTDQYLIKLLISDPDNPDIQKLAYPALKRNNVPIEDFKNNKRKMKPNVFQRWIQNVFGLNESEPTTKVKDPAGLYSSE